jgi:hypothetical protein
MKTTKKETKKSILKSFLWVLKSLISDERGAISSKRCVGIMCAIFLCISLYHNSFCDGGHKPSATLVQSVAILAGACLGMTSLDKIFGKVQVASKIEE